MGDETRWTADTFGGTGLGRALDGAWKSAAALGQAATESPVGQVIGSGLEAVGNSAGWVNENLPTRAAMRELAGWDQLGKEVGPDYARLQALVDRYDAGDTTVETEMQALAAELNDRLGVGSGKPLTERLQEAAHRDPDLCKVDLLHDLATGAAAGLVAPGAEVGAVRNLAGVVALDPVGQGLGLAAEGAVAGLRGAAGLRRGAQAAVDAAGTGAREVESAALASTRRAIEPYSEAEQAIINEQARQLDPDKRAGNVVAAIPHLDDPGRKLELVDAVKMAPEERAAIAHAPYLPHFATGVDDALTTLYDALDIPAEERGRLAGLTTADGWYGATGGGRDIHMSPWALWGKVYEEDEGDLGLGGYNTFRRHLAEKAVDALTHEIGHTRPLPPGVEADTRRFDEFVRDLRRQIGQERLRAAEQALSNRLKAVLSNDAHVQQWEDDTARIRRQEGSFDAARRRQ